MPDAALANLPLDQTISRSFIYFVSDDGGAYNANEAGTSVDRTDRITITINGQADIPVAQVSDVARFYFENNNSTTQSGKNLSTQSLSMLGNYDLSYAANPTEHGQHNLATGNIVSSLWSVEGEGNTITFDSWVDADGNEVNGRAYSVSRSDSLPNGPYIDGANLYHINGQVSMFTQDGSWLKGKPAHILGIIVSMSRIVAMSFRAQLASLISRFKAQMTRLNLPILPIRVRFLIPKMASASPRR